MTEIDRAGAISRVVMVLLSRKPTLKLQLTCLNGRSFQDQLRRRKFRARLQPPAPCGCYSANGKMVCLSGAGITMLVGWSRRACLEQHVLQEIGDDAGLARGHLDLRGGSRRD